MLKKVMKAVRGLASRDSIKRVETLEMITHNLLWRNPWEVVAKHLEIPEPIPQSNIAGDARLFANREEMLRSLGQGGEVAEVGVFRGDFSRVILRELRPRQFHLIDISFDLLNPDGLTSDEVVRHLGDSSTILNGFAPASLDLIYVDGDHSYEGVRKDLAAAHQALKPGGRIMCNDYTNWISVGLTPYGVARAVNEFVNAEGYVVEGLGLATWGNHDFLIRKPG